MIDEDWIRYRERTTTKVECEDLLKHQNGSKKGGFLLCLQALLFLIRETFPLHLSF